MERDQIIAAVLRGLEQGGPSANVLRGYVDEDSIDMILAVAEPLIRADEREQVCRREGHNPQDVSTPADLAANKRQLICSRCGATATELRATWEANDGE